MPTYKQMQQKNPEYDGDYWARCRALYAGGKKLLGNAKIMRQVFPRHLHELESTYAERLRRAYYIPYPGEIIGMITSAMFSEQVVVEADPDPDPWYTDWMDDVSPPGGQRQSLAQFLKDQVITALCCRRAWTLIDLPASDADPALPTAAPGSVLEQEQSGMLDAYACALDPEAVWDWECEKDGRLAWVLVHDKTAKRTGLGSDRSWIVEQWTYYTQDTWERWEIVYHVDQPPKDADELTQVGGGTHSFGEVPVIPFELPEGLWAMGKIECIAVAHLNKRNALSWAMYKSLLPVLTHYAQAADPLNEASADPDRITNQTIGQGHVVQLAEKDRLEYTAPDSSPYEVAGQDLNILRDEMHRVLHQMALSVDNSGAALQRSADSKQVDQASASVVLREFGKLVREHVLRIFEMVQVGRQDSNVSEWNVSGMDAYDDVTVDALVAQAAALEAVPIPSATFQREWKWQIAKRLLGDTVDDDKLAEIRKELDANIKNEQFTLEAQAAEAAVEATKAETEAVKAGGGKPAEDDKPPTPPKAKK